MPFGSRIMMTAPSPRMVLPEKAWMMAQPRRHRLHHDFLGVEHAIDHDAEGFVADLRDDDESAFGLLFGRVAELQQLAQIDQRQQLVAQPQNRRVLDPLDTMFLALFVAAAHAHEFDHRDLRDREAFAGASTISAETIASVSGILIVNTVP